jgi:hypothetical protein
LRRAASRSAAGTLGPAQGRLGLVEAAVDVVDELLDLAHRLTLRDCARKRLADQDLELLVELLVRLLERGLDELEVLEIGVGDGFLGRGGVTVLVGGEAVVDQLSDDRDLGDRLLGGQGGLLGGLGGLVGVVRVVAAAGGENGDRCGEG